jgi:2-dehydro-3-deoxyphosphogluconate aldolase/(4S)-4-hydroxy-2-oxoglutarate aldolase
MDAGQLSALVRAHRVMAIVRGTSEGAALATGRALLDEGVRLVEITLTTPGALATIAALRDNAPGGAFIGAGTVLTVEDVAAVERAGAQFIVTPAVTPAVAEASRRAIPCAAGAFTASEAYAAYSAGAEIVKLFPASAAGPGYLKALRDPLPQIPFMVVGGVGLPEAEAFVAAGAIGAGVGGPLVGDAASGGSLDALRSRAREFVSWAEGLGESP